MKGETGERWKTLCAQAAEEQNPEKLMKLIEEISRLLAEKENRLKAQRGQKPEDVSLGGDRAN